MMMRGIERKRIILLGDDDLLSVAIAATKLPMNVTVVDLDLALLNRVRHWSKGGRVEIVNHDLRVGFPLRLRRQFNIASADPPYTLAGQLLFAHRAMMAIRSSGHADLYICASRLYLTNNHIKEIEHFQLSGGFEISQVYENFNRYVAPKDVLSDMARLGVNWTSGYMESTLFHFVRCRRAKPPDLPTVAYNDIYTYGESNEAT